MNWVDWLWGRLVEIDWKGLGQFIVLLVSRRWLALLTTVTLLCLSVLATFMYAHRVEVYDGAIRDLLRRELSPTPERHKGLEAFLMSAIPLGVDDALRDTRIDENLRRALNKLGKAFQNSQTTEDYTSVLNSIRLATNGNAQLLTDDGEKGFLFFPTTILRRPLNDEQQHNLISSCCATNQLQQLLQAEKPLLQEVSFTGSKDVVEAMQELASTRILSRRASNTVVNGLLEYMPAQAYIITKNGLNRIFKRRIEHPEFFYARQFSPEIYFPARPYVLDALHGEEALPPFSVSFHSVPPQLFVSDNQQLLRDVFTVSRPYLDLAGNGIVITLSRAISAPGVTEAVLCIDVSFNETHSLKPALQNRLKQFDAHPITALLEIDGSGFVTANSRLEIVERGGARQISPVDAPKAEADMFEHLKGFIQEESNDLASILGYVQILHLDDSGLEVSVPISEVVPVSGSGIVKASLLLFRLDPAAYWRQTTLYGVFAAACFGAMILLLMYLWGTTVRREKDYETAFDKVAGVMQGAPCAYLRLDSNDRLLDCNRSAAKLLGLENMPVAEFRRFTLESFCADETSKRQYSIVQQARRTGGEVAPYTLLLTPKDGTPPKKVQIIAADIPSLARGKFPETFGVLLEMA